MDYYKLKLFQYCEIEWVKVWTIVSQLLITIYLNKIWLNILIWAIVTTDFNLEQAINA